MRGHQLEWFSAAFPGSAETEDLDGVRIVRAGRQATVHLCAFRNYRQKLETSFDIVIDQVNTVPFFTPLWSRIPIVMFIHQLAREVWWYESRFPLNALGFAIEPWYLRPYRNRPVLTVSASTHNDLIDLGFTGRIWVIPEGLEPAATQPSPGSVSSDFLYVGRLAPSKRVGDILRAFSIFAESSPGGRLHLVGSGSNGHVQFLTRLASRLRIEDRVTFHGRIPADAKYRLMASSQAVLMTSVREGWGLAVSEAGAVGTPAITYDVPGLRDSVVDGVTGVVVQQTPEALARAMVALTRDPSRRDSLSSGARRMSQRLSFDSSAQVVESALEAIVGGPY